MPGPPLFIADGAGSGRQLVLFLADNFRKVTGLSPIQYQKAGCELMLADKENAIGAAFKAGFGSATRFTREYRRPWPVACARHPRLISRLRAQSATGADG